MKTENKTALRPHRKESHWWKLLWVGLAGLAVFAFLLLLLVSYPLWEQIVKMQKLVQAERIPVAAETAAMGEEFSIGAYVLKVENAVWTDALDGFSSITVPEGGRCLLVNYVCYDGADASDKTYVCLHLENGYVIPISPVILTDDGQQQKQDTSEYAGWTLDTSGSKMLFLLEEDTDVSQLTLEFYTGEPAIEEVPLYEYGLDQCVSISLEVAS